MSRGHATGCARAVAMAVIIAASALATAALWAPPVSAGSCTNPVPHGPILITKDSDFTAANGLLGGTGTASDPYVIGDVRLTDLSRGYGIEVHNIAGSITAYFTIDCVAASFKTSPPAGAVLVWILGVHRSTVVTAVQANAGEAAGSAGILVDQSSQIVLTGESINKFAGNGLEVRASDHVTVVDSKSKAGENGLLVLDSAFVQVGQACDLSSGAGCNEFTYDDGWGVRVEDSHDVVIIGTFGDSNDTGSFVLDGPGTYNVYMANDLASGTGDICPGSIGKVSTGDVVDYAAGLAIINGAYDITVRNSTAQGNTHWSLMNGGDTYWFNACTGVLVRIQKTPTPPGGPRLDLNFNCYFNETGFTPTPIKFCPKS